MIRERHPFQHDLFGEPPVPSGRIAPEESRKLVMLLATLLLAVVRPNVTRKVDYEQDHA